MAKNRFPHLHRCQEFHFEALTLHFENFWSIVQYGYGKCSRKKIAAPFSFKKLIVIVYSMWNIIVHD